MGNKVHPFGKKAEILPNMQVSLKGKKVHQVDGNVDRLQTVKSDKWPPQGQPEQNEAKDSHHEEFSPEYFHDARERGKNSGINDEVMEYREFERVDYTE